ncbi:hypothetical protein Lbys_2864 [Leadbetterella byssophila DSM 17132]|uniref:Uncharacterized protein n=1 Tax=Leadbetterella byssophila (strain DSM 17132 / JCM 16389 / KACC 11308 / NBRC 106382 / 4M15) TaxID=649349 RepID=E4RRZ4_LEAB4|nr:hypothetical protein Lbys_2864 [Leadbetterella byssophila DSM 17132]
MGGAYRFAWQPHGSQFKIIEEIPQNCIYKKIKEPNILDKENVLKTLVFNKTWIKVINRIKNN